MLVCVVTLDIDSVNESRPTNRCHQVAQRIKQRLDEEIGGPSVNRLSKAVRLDRAANKEARKVYHCWKANHLSTAH